MAISRGSSPVSVASLKKEEEQFCNIKLDTRCKKWKWEDDDCYHHRLIVKQIFLGVTAKEGEYNVIEVTTGKIPVKAPIAVLKIGETRVVYPNIELFEGPLVFELIQGKGPVHIQGIHIKEKPIVIDLSSEDIAYSDNEEEESFGEAGQHGSETAS